MQRRSSAASPTCRPESTRPIFPLTRVRVFAGYSGWGPGQLEAELEEPSWIIAPADPSDVFAADPDELWRTVLGRKGGRFNLIASMPYDPGLN